MIIHKYNNFIFYAPVMQPDNISLKFLLDKSLKYYNLENFPNDAGNYNFKYANKFLTDFICIK